MKISIKAKFLFFTLSLFVVVFMVVGSISYFKGKSEFTQLVSSQIDMLQRRAELNLPQLLWDFETDKISAFSTAELNSDFVSGIIVSDMSDVIFSGVNDEEGQISEEKISEFKADDTVKTFKLIRVDGEKKVEAGKISVRYNQPYIDGKLHSILLQQVIQSIVFCTALVVLILLLLNYIVIKPLEKISEAVADIAHGEGDLTKRISVTSRDEVGVLAKLFNIFLEKLHSLIADISQKSKRMEDATSEVSVVTTNVIQAIDSQNAETDQIATAVTEMEATSASMADNAIAAATASSEAYEYGESVRDTVKIAIESVESLNAEIDTSCAVIFQLQENVENITAVLDVIRGIAEQTNLLALNAAIEAARAGEQGRGFAVVADEVRTLASRTQDSTQEIQEMINRLQEGARAAVDTMTGSKVNSQKTLEQNSEVGTAIDRITQAQETIDKMNTQIASAAEEQKSVASDMNQRLLLVVDVSENISNSANNAGKISTESNSAAIALGSSLAQFKI
ncbi:MAG: methyl-accepting chemotaxis protein [Candidatus Brocadiaceae bacterium]|nr:methyl-accepting chemotaxis protein [Candidatus Brocadiaceae bacterium]